MATNWRIHKTISFVAIAITIAALLGIFGIGSLDNKLFDVIQWKVIVIACQGYLAWAFYNLINY